MAKLKPTEQLELLRDGFANLSQPLDETIYQQALTTCVEWLEDEKEIENDDADALSYVRKMKSVIKLITEGNKTITGRLTQIMIARIGATAVNTLSNLKGQSEVAVLNLFENNMLKLIEDFAQVTKYEKAAYNRYVPRRLR